MKRLLIISYYFPPAGGSEVQRSLRFTRYLREFGWEPMVLTTANGAFPNRDDSLLAEVPAGTRIVRTGSWDPFHTYGRLTGKGAKKVLKLGSVYDGIENRGERIARWIRANIFLPDARIGWVPFAIAGGRTTLAKHQVDALLTTGPPHSTHFIGWALHKTTGVPWVADFRDPWVDINYYGELPHSRAALKLDTAMEQAVLRHASLVTTVSPFWRQELLAKLDTRNPAPVEVIHNGYDEKDFVGMGHPETEPGEFSLTHVGSLYDSRNPVFLWRAIARLRQEGAIPQFRIQLIGRTGQVVRETLEYYKLTDIVTIRGFQSHREALRSMCESDMLFFVIEPFPLDRGMITGKLYEYLASNRPIMGIGPDRADAAGLLRETRAGRLFNREDDAGTAAFIRQHYAAQTRGTVVQTGASRTAQAYSWKSQTGLLAQLLDNL